MVEQPTSHVRGDPFYTCLRMFGSYPLRTFVHVCSIHTEQEADPEPTATAPEPAPAKEYVPIGHQKANADGKICRYGSRYHLQISSHMCPLNQRWEGDKSRFQVHNVFA